MTPLEAAASIVLLEFQQSYGLGFVAPNGRIVTCFHVVADELEITAHLSDGRALPVKSVCAIDTRRDLAVLDVGLLDARPVTGVGERLVDDAQPVHVFGMVPSEGRARWVDAQLESVQPVGPGLTVYTLSRDVPADASGGPLLGADGRTLGVVTVAETDEGVSPLAVPWRYVEPMLRQHQELPLSSLVSDGPRPPRREVPEHPLSLLEGSSLEGLQATVEALGEAIHEGAPAYNEGEVVKCYEAYADGARAIIAARADCPGVQRALAAGLARAEGLEEVDAQAWALRDAFDGLLVVIEKYLRVHLGISHRPGKPTLLN